MGTTAKTEVTILVGVDAGMQEPKQTMNLGYDEILKLLEDKYRMGKTGKEYNLVTKYTNSIVNAVVEGDVTYPIFLKFFRIRPEWVKAAFHFMNKGVVEISGAQITIWETK